MKGEDQSYEKQPEHWQGDAAINLHPAAIKAPEGRSDHSSRLMLFFYDGIISHKKGFFNAIMSSPCIPPHKEAETLLWG